MLSAPSGGRGITFNPVRSPSLATPALGRPTSLYRIRSTRFENNRTISHFCISHQAEELATLKHELEPALAAAVSDAAAATEAAAREQAGRTEAELRAGTMTESLNLELEAERPKRKGLEERLRLLEKVRVSNSSWLRRARKTRSETRCLRPPERYE